MRIVLCAQSFGFGPVSKAATIARALRRHRPGVELVFCADRIAREFLVGEGLWRPGRDIATDRLAAEAVAALAGPADAVISVLDPDLATAFAATMPVYFVDSLGFMWDSAFLERFGAVRDARRYFVQDAFGAAGRLAALGVRHPVAVGAIVDIRAVAAPVLAELVVNLGGLLNIYDPAPIRVYVDKVMSLVETLAGGRATMVLTSREAVATFERLARSPVPVRSLAHDQALAAFRQAGMVLTSPGLTTLLELANGTIAFHPLPPQNFSQALILGHGAALLAGRAPVWDFLAAHYRLDPDMDEALGVRLVQDRNAALLGDSGFVADYLGLLRQCAPARLPETVVAGGDGAAAIAAMVLEDLGGCRP